MANVMVGIPCYGDQLHASMIVPLIHPSQAHSVRLSKINSSACAMTMNRLWIEALEARDRGEITHFIMLHNDIVPEIWFVDKMMAELERVGADVLSAVSPIKDPDGFTSTAMDEPMGDVDPYWRVRRLTMKEVYKREATFTDPKLLVNTGLMLCDLRKPWTEEIYFTLEDRIIRWRGKRVAVMMPEDWGFSRMAKKAGASLWATRAVALEHFGLSSFPNTFAWGSKDTDSVPPPPDPVIEAAALEAEKIEGYMSPDELRWLALAARDNDVIEVGSWLGRSTKAMAATAKHVYAVDNWKGSSNGDATGDRAKQIDAYATFKANLAGEIQARKVEIINVDHADLDKHLNGDGIHTIPKADIVFLDADHEEAFVRRDIVNCLKLVKPGGLLCGHDFSEAHPGVIAAVKDMLPGYKSLVGSIWAYPVDALPLAGEAQSDQKVSQLRLVE